MLKLGIVQSSGNSVPTGGAFITEWQTGGANTSITLPLVNSRSEGSLAYNCIVSWGDGTPDSTVMSYNSASANHTYVAAGTYEVSITGTCEGWSFNNTGSKLYIRRVINWGSNPTFGGFKYLKSGFYGCSNLIEIPATGSICASGTGILTDGFYHTFHGCNQILPNEDLFKLHPNVTTNAFNGTFVSCSVMTTIPAGLFKYNVNVSTYGFQSCFYSCSSLTTLPTDLFRYNTAVSRDGFYECFSYCGNLTTLPTDLFRYNVAVFNSGFTSTFTRCYNLATVPIALFKYNVLNLNFSGTFYYCESLRQNKWIFYESGEEGTRFLNQAVNFSYCFQRNNFYGTQGSAPELWTCSFGTSTPNKTLCWRGAGNSLTSLDNYTSIPTAWK